MTRRKATEPTACDAAQAKANEYHPIVTRSIGAAMEEIADQIPADMEIQIRISSGMFEAMLIDSHTREEVPVAIDFEEFADELLYLLNVAKGRDQRNKVLGVKR
jgi:hypothetical protein